MLVNFFNDQKVGLVYPNGVRYEDALAPVKDRLAKAQVYKMDRDAVAMAAGVALSKPTSLVSALPWVRLPFELTWIEFANQDLRDAMEELGSPNVKVPDATTHIERSGFLIRQEGRDLIMEYIHLDVSHGSRSADLAPVELRFRTTGDMPNIHPDISMGRSAPALAKGRMRQYLKLLSSDPTEITAHEELSRRFSWTMHPDMHNVAAAGARMMGADKIEQIQVNQAREAFRLFHLQILPALILINCRNAIEVEHVPAPDKLNKKRLKSGKAPLVEHKVVKVSLTASVKRRAAVAGQEPGRWARSAFVGGHFKVRKTGIFWWSPHVRQGYAPAATRTHIITP